MPVELNNRSDRIVIRMYSDATPGYLLEREILDSQAINFFERMLDVFDTKNADLLELLEVVFSKSLHICEAVKDHLD